MIKFELVKGAYHVGKAVISCPRDISLAKGEYRVRLPWAQTEDRETQAQRKTVFNRYLPLGAKEALIMIFFDIFLPPSLFFKQKSTQLYRAPRTTVRFYSFINFLQ